MEQNTSIFSNNNGGNASHNLPLKKMKSQCEETIMSKIIEVKDDKTSQNKKRGRK
jgi:hypothetical protein|tara:strand:+ start:328 stop:492 length:165 start_codon:yes stop_codon:yes gene_type:complete